MKSSILVAAATASCAHAFVTAPVNTRTSVSTNMALIDGVKSAFGGDGMGELDSERETPIDRWMGWNTKKDAPQQSISKEPSDFVDSMDSKNYVIATLTKPMGIVFEENDSEIGGIFALELSEGSSAETAGTVRPGDQLVAVGEKKVSGLVFEEALGTIIDSAADEVKLVFFRGPSKFLYGPAGASQEWLDAFIKGE
mmetsp:Transcript_23266/g.50404  ORF Transcript_23266/g.50404 Transcript_23266/m.50404 type:complete len:197 (-) Transcript_23266:248-838(-)